MIERFVLPKGCSRTTKHAVGRTACSTFKPAHQIGQIDLRSQDYVDMIGHNDPGMQRVQPADRFTILEHFCEHVRDTGLLKPERTGIALIAPVRKGADGSRIATLRRKLGCAGGHGTGQPPRHENGRIGRNPMRQASAIEHSFPVEAGRPQTPMVCPTLVQHCSAKLRKQFAEIVENPFRPGEAASRQ